MQKLIGFGDLRTSNIVAKIAAEELAHVAVGLYWFLSVCQKMGRAPCPTFKGLIQSYSCSYFKRNVYESFLQTRVQLLLQNC